jgi:amidohydrolase
MDVDINFEDLIKLRKELHQHPELSGYESNTAERIAKHLQKFKPDQIVENIGGNGLAAIFEGKEEGPAVLFRCDLDALPINEINDFDYKSVNEGISHKCGHDGHMTIMTGLAEAISQKRPRHGKAVLLFQPSEENGQGAEEVINDPKFNIIKPDYVYALHNLPGFEKSAVVINENIFASASRGMIVKLYGKTSHAGEPDKGLSPAVAMADLVKDFTYLPQKYAFDNFTLVTVIHARLGEIAFGTTPGYAEVMATLRSYTNEDMDKLVQQAEKLIEKHVSSHGLKYTIDYTEEFLATENNRDSVNIVRESAKENDLQIIQREEPFRWSEDFSHFTYRYPGALFGLGSGIMSPQLHNPDYDFPDDILESGIKVFFGIFNKHLNHLQ